MTWALSRSLVSTASSLPASSARVVELGVALREAGIKIRTAVSELRRQEDDASSYLHRFIAREVEQRLDQRGPAYWDAMFEGMELAELRWEDDAIEWIRGLPAAKTASGKTVTLKSGIRKR